VARELKLVLAFSTASQLGYMFLAIGSAGLLNEFALGFLSSFNHLISHAIFKAALFMGAGAVIHTVHSRFLDDMGGLSKYMKITFLTMLIAALSLSGLPPLMGFWTKDGILETVFESGLQLPFILAVITASITAFYSMKIVFRTFTMPESKNVKNLIKEHKIHESNLVMWLPYAICAIASLLGGLLWFFFAGNLNNAILRHVLALENTHLFFKVHLDPFTTTLSIFMVAIGISAAILAYSGPKYAEILNKLRINNPLLQSTYGFLYDRWYINSIYYRIIVNGFSWLSRNIFRWFDSFIIDNIYHAILPWITTSSAKGIFRQIETDIIDKSYHIISVKIARFFSNIFRSLQTGRINHYLLTFLIGFVLIITFLIIWVI
jgi:NADH-quinone oxidoreductase subunit L